MKPAETHMLTISIKDQLPDSENIETAALILPVRITDDHCIIPDGEISLQLTNDHSEAIKYHELSDEMKDLLRNTARKLEKGTLRIIRNPHH